MITLENTKETRALRRLIANELGLELKKIPTCQFVIEASGHPPEKSGQPGHYVTPNGSICHHPNAYRRRSGKPRYVASSVKITTGIEWLNEKTGMNNALMLDLQMKLHIELIGATP